MKHLAIVMLMMMTASHAWASAGLWIDGKVMNYEKPNFRVMAPKYEFLIDGSKINEKDFETFRKANKNQVVRALIPENAIVSAKKLAKNTSAKKRTTK